ncbi:hypothetical protein L6R53_20175 [Myxococcota bacterium]|nr:hypothetical protein [Myxococcota bacterium]
MAPPVLTNLRTVSAAWRDEWTGVLVVETPGLGGCSRVQIRAGGLVDAGQSRRLARGITVGVVSFEATSVAGRGDRALLGRVLTAVSRVMSERIRGTLPSEAVVELAMPPERLAGCVAPVLVDRLLGRKAVVGALLRDGTATVQELRALGWLGVVRLQRLRRPRSKRSMLLPEGETLEVTPPAELTVPREAPLEEPPRAGAPTPPELAPPAAAAEIEAAPGLLGPGEEGGPEDDQTEESLVVPQVDPRPIPLPPHELQVAAGAELHAPVVHMGMFAPRFDASEVPRLAGVAFGEEQLAEDLPENLRAARGAEAEEMSQEALLSGLDDELADVLQQDELGLLLGLPGAVARARARELTAAEPPLPSRSAEVAPTLPRSPAPEAVRPPAGQAAARSPRGDGARIEVPRIEVDVREAIGAARGYNLGHLLDPCQLRAEGGGGGTRRRTVQRGGHR